MYALNLDTSGRILSATFAEYATEEMPKVDVLPSNEETDDITEFLYVSGEYVYSPKPVPPEPAPEPSRLDEVEAQMLYTAMMTDTLLEE